MSFFRICPPLSTSRTVIFRDGLALLQYEAYAEPTKSING